MDGMENKGLLYRLSISVITIVLFLLSYYISPVHPADRKDATPDLSVLVPSKTDIQKTAEKYEHLLLPRADIEAVSRIANPADKNTQTQMLPAVKSLQESIQEGTAEKRTPYIFYLFSASVPDVAVDSVFSQASKLPFPFFGVIRGVDNNKKILQKLENLPHRENGFTVKINPRIYKQVKAEMVPAFVFAYCPTPSRFRSKDCDYKYILYGDMSLTGALEIMARENSQDKDINQIYEAMRNAF